MYIRMTYYVFCSFYKVVQFFYKDLNECFSFFPAIWFGQHLSTFSEKKKYIHQQSWPRLGDIKVFFSYFWRWLIPGNVGKNNPFLLVLFWFFLQGKRTDSSKHNSPSTQRILNQPESDCFFFIIFRLILKQTEFHFVLNQS